MLPTLLHWDYVHDYERAYVFIVHRSYVCVCVCVVMALVTDASGGSTHSSIPEQKVTLIFFLGGVTFAEISALRFLAQLEDGSVQFHIVSCLTLNEHIKTTEHGPLYCNMVIGTLVVDGWAVTFGTVRRGLEGPSSPRPLFAVPNVTAHLSMASVPTLYYLMWHYTLKG